MKFWNKCVLRRSIFYKTIFVLLLLAGGAAGVLWRTPPSVEENRSASTSLADKSILHIGNGMEPANLDPTKVMGISEINILLNLFEGLTVPDPVTWEPRPGAAVSWDISPDGKQYVFHLQPTGKWSDQRPLTAYDFVFAWRRLLDPKNAAPDAYFLFHLKNAKKFNAGEEKDPTKLGVYARNAHTLEVELAYPAPGFLTRTWSPVLAPLPQHVVEKWGDHWVDAKHMVSNGPFCLSEWLFHRYVKLTKNPQYWDAEQVHFSQVFFHPVESSTTEEHLFATKALQLTHGIPYSRIPFYEKNHPEQVQYSHLLGVHALLLNVDRRPLQDIRVRQALSMVIDRKSLAAVCGKNQEQVAVSFLPPYLKGFSSGSPLLPSVDVQTIAVAKGKLAAAGYPGGKGFPPLVMRYYTNENHRKVMAAIQEMWRRDLGVSISLHNEEFKMFLRNRKNRDFDIARIGWVSTSADPESFLEPFLSKSAFIPTGWRQPKFDNLILLAQQMRNPIFRLQALEDAEKLLMTEMPIIPLYTIGSSRLLDPRFRVSVEPGVEQIWKTNHYSVVYLKYVYLK